MAQFVQGRGALRGRRDLVGLLATILYPLLHIDEQSPENAVVLLPHKTSVFSSVFQVVCVEFFVLQVPLPRLRRELAGTSTMEAILKERTTMATHATHSRWLDNFTIWRECLQSCC
jgi:hypothetical protein